MQREIQMKVNMIHMNMIPVVSADAVSWGCEVDPYGRNKPYPVPGLLFRTGLERPG